MNARPQDVQLAKAAAKKNMQSQVARINRFAMIAMGVSAVLALTLLVAVMASVSLAQKAANVPVVYVKTDPITGQHEIELATDGGENDRFVEAGIEGSLLRYVKSRHGRNPATIQNDFGVASRYLAPNLLKAWVEGGASAEIKKVEECLTSCAIAAIQIGSFDTQRVTTDAADPVWETTVYFRRTSRAVATGDVTGTERMMTRFRWRLRPIERVARSVPELMANPHGIEIIEEAIERDVLAEQAERNGRFR